MFRPLAISFAFCAALFAQSNPAPRSADDPWRALRFLIGTWEAATKGGSAGASGSGDYTFRLELRDHILARHSANAACRGPADFDCDHGDLLYIYPDSPDHRPRAIYFDNEGHVIHYEVTAPAQNTAVFLSPSNAPGPQYRLSYELHAQIMSGKFEIRQPGAHEFRAYLEWSGKRKK